MGEFKGGDKAGLLVQAAEVTSQVDDGILFLKGFIGQGVTSNNISGSILYLPRNPQTFPKSSYIVF